MGRMGRSVEAVAMIDGSVLVSPTFVTLSKIDYINLVIDEKLSVTLNGGELISEKMKICL